MTGYRFAAVAVMFAAVTTVTPVAAVQPPPRRSIVEGPRGTTSVDRWLHRLANEIDHLEEDLHYERGNYPAELRERADQAARAVGHFHQVLRQGGQREHLMGHFEEMDRQVHELVARLNDSTDRWLRRQASRIRYADDQLHYALRTTRAEGPGGIQDLLARQTQLLDNEARQLQMLVKRGAREDDGVRDAVDVFVDEVEELTEVVGEGADAELAREGFRDVDEAWREVTERLNRSSYSFYVRRRAQDVNRVHNQLHGILETGQSSRGDVSDPPATHHRSEESTGG